MSAKKKASKAAQVAELRKKKASKPAGKAAKAKKAKAKKPDLAVVERGIGHNSHTGEINEPLVALFGEYEALEANKKEISKAQRDIVARARTEHNVLSSVFKHEVNLRKKDPDVRAQFESGHADLKDMIGFQMALPLNSDEAEEDGDTEMSAEGGDYSRGDAGDTIDDEMEAAGNGYN